MKSKVITALVAVGMMVNVANAEIISKNGVAKDSATGLMWQDEPYTEAELQTYKANTNNGKVGNWNYAKAYCENLTLGGFSDWRLPNIYELSTLIDNKKNEEPYIIDGFENFAFACWSSTNNPSMYDGARTVLFLSGGFTGYNLFDRSNYIRCVRGKQINYNFLQQLKNKEHIKVSQKNINDLSLKSEIKLKNFRENLRKKENDYYKEKSKKVISHNTWSIGYKYQNSDNYAPFSYESTEIICSNGTKGTVFDYYNRTGGDRYIINGNQAVNSINEGADYICGNK